MGRVMERIWPARRQLASPRPLIPGISLQGTPPTFDVLPPSRAWLPAPACGPPATGPPVLPWIAWPERL